MSARSSEFVRPAAAAACPQPPRAARRARRLRAHGHVRVDDYYWLRDDERSDPAVRAHLEAENDYVRTVLAPLEPLQARLGEELAERLEQEDMSVPVKIDDYFYYTRYAERAEHPIYARRLHSMEAEEEILFDANARAAGRDYYDVGDVAVSDDHRMLAFSEDVVGREQYTARVIDLASGELLADELGATSGSLVWGADGATLYYVALEPGTLIPHRLVRHRIGTAAAADEILYEETDSAFCIEIDKSRSREWVMMYLVSTLSTETWLLDAAAPDARPQLFLARQPDHEYWIEPVGASAWIVSNWQAPNFRILYSPLLCCSDTSKWRELIGHRPSVVVEDFIVFDDFLAIEERHDGMQRLRVRSHDGRIDYLVETGDEVHTAVIDENPRLATSTLRYAYASLRMPDTTCEIDMASGERQVLKRDDVGGGFEPDNYVTHRLHATARDGTAIPITLLHRKALQADGTHPLYLIGYGAYGYAYDPQFDTDLLSLVDRDIVVAIAHVRGGGELGRHWYDQGRTRQKMNSFSDFIDVTEYLIDSGWARRDGVVASGRSAGGLLMGAVANLRPDLYRAIVTEVPFVDVVTTMLDESIPLTSFEFDEWGDPREPDDYRRMLGWSPYDQVRRQSYPHMLVSTALWDAAVPYWEPAKWVARLREHDSGDRLLLLYTAMDAGHTGPNGRYRRLADRAREYAFVLYVLGLNDVAEGPAAQPAQLTPVPPSPQ